MAVTLCPSFLFFSSLLLLLAAFPLVRSGDAEALLSLKNSIDPLGVLQWRSGIDVCKWEGVKECLNERVMKLVVERFNLSGKLDGKSLNELDQLRVLSFKENSLSGQIPELSGLANLKSLFLNDNRFSGGIPVSLSGLHRLKVVVLSGNRISGHIPLSLVDLSRLYVLYLQDNQLSGAVPAFAQNSLRLFNVSNNLLLGEIPRTAPMLRFNSSSFNGNADLCGEQIERACSLGPSPSPSNPIQLPKHRKRLVLTIASSAGGVALLCIAAVVVIMCVRKRSKDKEAGNKVVAAAGGGEEGTPSICWDQGVGSLAFLGPGDELMSYSMEDLLKASAETLGRGTMGSTYKAVMESGYIVTVKRLKESRYPRMEEFRRHIEIIGRLRHPHLVPLRAYFHAKEERLLVYDYFPNGSLFSLVHGMPSLTLFKSLLTTQTHSNYYLCCRIKIFRWVEASALDFLPQNSRGFSCRISVHPSKSWPNSWKFEGHQCSAWIRLRVLPHRLRTDSIQEPGLTRGLRGRGPLLQSSRMPRSKKAIDTRR